MANPFLYPMMLPNVLPPADPVLEALIAPTNWQIHPLYVNTLSQIVPSSGPWQSYNAALDFFQFAKAAPPYAGPLTIGPGTDIPDIPTLAWVLASTFAQSFNDQLRIRANQPVFTFTGHPTGLRFNVFQFRVVFVLHVILADGNNIFKTLDTQNFLPTIRRPNNQHFGAYVAGSTHHRVVDVFSLSNDLINLLMTFLGRVGGSDPMTWTIVSTAARVFSFIGENLLGGCSSGTKKSSTSVVINSIEYFSPRGKMHNFECFYRCVHYLIKTGQLSWPTKPRISTFMKKVIADLDWVANMPIYTGQIIDFAKFYHLSVRIWDPAMIDEEDKPNTVANLPFNSSSLIDELIIPGKKPFNIFLYKNHYLIIMKSQFVKKDVCSRCGKNIIRGRYHRCGESLRDYTNDASIMETNILPDKSEEELRSHIASIVYDDYASNKAKEELKIKEMYDKLLNEGQSILLLGHAGTGKTYIVNDICSNYIKNKKKVIVAHEAVAVSNYLKLADKNTFVGTIYSIFKIPLFTNLSTWLSKLKDSALSRDLAHQHKKPKIRQAKKIPTIDLLRILFQDVELLFIDEINTITPYIFELMNSILQLIRGSTNPFGGIQVVLTGDFLQRGPINSHVNEDETSPVFMCKSFNQMNLHICNLFLVKRLQNLQKNKKEQEFLRLQLLMAYGILRDEEIDQLNCYQTTDSILYDEKTTVLCSTNADVREHNSKILSILFQKHKVFNITAETWPEKAPLSLLRIAQKDLRVFVGMRVLLTSNHWFKTEYVGNGSLGTITNIDYLHRKIFVLFDKIGKVIELISIKLPNTLNNKMIVRQIPLLPAYSITMSKSEGMSLQNVCIKTGKCTRRNFSAGEMYVAISRATSVSRFSISGKIRGKYIRTSRASLMWQNIIQSNRLPNDLELRKLTNILSTRPLKVNGDKQSPVICLYPKDKGNKDNINVQLFNPLFHFSDTTVIFKEGNLITSDDEKAKISTAWSTNSLAREKSHRIKPHSTFEHSIVYDFETWNNKDTNYIHKIYFVYADYWINNEIKETKIISYDANNSNIDHVFDQFTDWVFTLLRSHHATIKKSLARTSSKVYSTPPPIVMIAFNGSRYDTHFIANKLWNSSSLNQEFIHGYTIRSKTIINLDLRSRDHPTKLVLRMWDPYLIVNSSLRSAVKSYCPSLSIGKDIFPHKYINRVGPKNSICDSSLKEIIIDSDFYTDEDKDEVRRRMAEGLLKPGSKPGTVMLPLMSHLFKYGALDVVSLEYLVGAMDSLCFESMLPGVSALQFSTAAQMTRYGWLSNIESNFRYQPQHDQKKGDKYTEVKIGKKAKQFTKIHLISQRLDNLIRKSVYGGRCYPRITSFRSKQLNDLENNRGIFQGKVGSELYDLVDDSFVYMDVHSMYVSIMKNKRFPYGPHIEITLSEADKYLQHWLHKLTVMKNNNQDLRNNELPMFVACVDVITVKTEVEPPLAQRGRCDKSDKNDLFWSNDDKIQQYYNSVDLILALRNGCKIRNCSWLIYWEKKGKVLESWMNTTLAMRKRGGVFNQQGKLLGNSTYGVCLKRMFNTEFRTVTNNKELQDIVSDTTLKIERCVFQGDSNFIHFLLKKVVNENDSYSTSCPQIGTFILGYAHELLDSFYEQVNLERRNPDPNISLRCQASYTDTDSIIFPWKALKNPNLVRLIGDEEGLLGDDLVGKWRKDNKSVSNNTTCSICDKKSLNLKFCIHELALCKIIESYSPSPKVYALKYIDPNGKIHDDTLKFKGISQRNIKITAANSAASRTDNFNERLRFQHFKDQEALTVSRQGITPLGFYPNRPEEAAGYAPLDVKSNILSRTIFGRSWEKRTFVYSMFPELKNNQDLQFKTLPLGYAKK